MSGLVAVVVVGMLMVLVGLVGTVVVAQEQNVPVYDEIRVDVNVSGTFRIPAAGEEYSELTEYYYRINAPSSAPHIALAFDSVLTECGWDFLYVHDGQDKEAPLALAFAQTNNVSLPPVVYSSSNALFLHFHSDPYVVGKGIEAAVAFSPCPRACSGNGACVAGANGTYACECSAPFSGPRCDTLSAPDPRPACATADLCKCPGDFTTSHDVFLEDAGAAELRTMQRALETCSTFGMDVVSLPACKACSRAVPTPASSTVFVAEACTCNLACVNGTCDLGSQRCLCQPGYYGILCDTVTPISTSGYTGASPPSTYSGSTTLSNIFVLVVLTLLVFIVVVAIMLCKHRRPQAPIQIHQNVPRLRCSVPLFIVDLPAARAAHRNTTKTYFVVHGPWPTPSQPPLLGLGSGFSADNASDTTAALAALRVGVVVEYAAVHSLHLRSSVVARIKPRRPRSASTCSCSSIALGPILPGTLAASISPSAATLGPTSRRDTSSSSSSSSSFSRDLSR
ncbi:uncharacterized protein AMSG_10710 [Thecamonas trahens ATCC 50062]|uniref:EGF-like domain-containing protein n=1 Tax=Thecamonas trahens ATCC 50062 TaxID=461836 RepID=A0A0L0DSX4_THETB|nr:hypothetical protein AMSG_10710 [Thecamonas trahens ATCC 50062]KNC55111.1 hypothetical protein AMSG_10710 [Thecamonas trahens ATCC 50062]|eukprot:XP_013753294.1 hypothetical protein AMSG_10710 [Thecamonas trahens ATCC 50062]